VTSVTETNCCREVFSPVAVTPDQEGIMLLHSHIHDGIDCKQRDYGFVLALVCMLWLALAVASGVMSKGGAARVISNESWGDDPCR